MIVAIKRVMPAMDPFGAFVSDSDEDDDNFAPSAAVAATAAAALIKAANHPIRTSERPNEAARQRQAETDPSNKSSPAESASSPLPPALSTPTPWPAPTFLHPDLRFVNLPGMIGRGYVATHDLAAGTLVLVEEPVMTWPTNKHNDCFGTAAVQRLLQSHDAFILYHQLEHLHPTRAAVLQFQDWQQQQQQQRQAGTDHGHGDDEDVSDEFLAMQVQIGDAMRELRSMYDTNVLQDKIDLAHAHGVANADGTPVHVLDVLRLLLVFRYNGLESGVYLHLAMWNHACVANCVKFAHDHVPMVRTTRRVRRGEAVTISYVPHVVCHATRRRHLWQQHRFDIGDTITSSSVLLRMELVQGKLPPSSVVAVRGRNKEDEPVTTRIETATQELEQIGFQLLSDYGPDPETAEALEQSSIELLRRAVEQLDNGRHILIMPILRLHIDAGDAVLVSQHQLSGKQQLLLLLRQLVSALYLSQLQSDLYGYDHYALAQTHNDIAQAMEHVIHLSPTDTAYKHALEVGQQFAHLKSTSMSFPVDVTSMRSRARYHHEEHERIKTLYPDTAA